VDERGVVSPSVKPSRVRTEINTVHPLSPVKMPARLVKSKACENIGKSHERVQFPPDFTFNTNFQKLVLKDDLHLKTLFL
jgi:hypothetical protein